MTIRPCESTVSLAPRKYEPEAEVVLETLHPAPKDLSTL